MLVAILESSFSFFCLVSFVGKERVDGEDLYLYWLQIQAERFSMVSYIFLEVLSLPNAYHQGRAIVSYIMDILQYDHFEEES